MLVGAKEEWEVMEFLPEINPLGEKKPTRGRLWVTLADFPCLKKSRSILKVAVAPIELFADEKQESRDVTLRMVVDECNRIWHTDISSRKSTISVDDAVALQ